jgi:CTP:molybdopterin cytidylyltransferase MocA
MSAVLKQKFLSGDENLYVQHRDAATCHARERGHPVFLRRDWIPACERVKKLALSLGL